MSSLRLKCTNIGCSAVFKHPMQKKRHLEKGKCLGTQPDKLFQKIDGDYKCKKCETIVKHSNNLTRHKDSCSGASGKVKQLNKSSIKYVRVTCNK